MGRENKTGLSVYRHQVDIWRKMELHKGYTTLRGMS